MSQVQWISKRSLKMNELHSRQGPNDYPVAVTSTIVTTNQGAMGLQAAKSIFRVADNTTATALECLLPVLRHFDNVPMRPR
jgi:hypothetical protein